MCGPGTKGPAAETAAGTALARVQQDPMNRQVFTSLHYLAIQSGRRKALAQIQEESARIRQQLHQKVLQSRTAAVKGLVSEHEGPVI